MMTLRRVLLREGMAVASDAIEESKNEKSVTECLTASLRCGAFSLSLFLFFSLHLQTQLLSRLLQLQTLSSLSLFANIPSLTAGLVHVRMDNYFSEIYLFTIYCAQYGFMFSFYFKIFIK